MKVSIGRRVTKEVSTLKEAQTFYKSVRNESGEGASSFPDGKITGGYKISYNGRVWLKGEAVEVAA